MLSDPSVIRTRITTPRRRGELLARQRLYGLLDEMVEKRLVLISAPAGYGKTSLLVDYASRCPMPVCWYSVDRLDFDPQRFISYFIAAIQQKYPAFGIRASAALSGSQNQLDIDYITTVLINDLYDHVSEHFLLVLDDFHLVNESLPVRNFVSNFLQHVEENCHLIITSRSLLSLPVLPLLASRSDVGGISFEELAFNAEEIRQMYKQNQHEILSVEASEDIQHRTEGWVTGIILASQVNQHLTAARARLARVSGFGLEEYFLQIIDGLPTELREFLLWSSLLEEFNSARCDDVITPVLGLDNPPWQTWMNAIQHNNLFVLPVGDQGDWLRYHPLFLDFLQARVFREIPNVARRIELSLAASCIQKLDWDRAFAIYHRINAVDEMASLIEKASPDLIAGGRISTLSAWLDALPGEDLNNRPYIVAMQGYVAMILGDTRLAMALYNQAVNALGNPSERIHLARVLSLRATLNRILGHLDEAIADARESMTLIQNNLELRKIQGDALRCIGQCYFHQGKLREAVNYFEQSLQVMLSIHDTKNEAIVRLELGAVYENMGKYGNSLKEYQTALNYWKQVDNPIYLSNLLNNLGVIQQMTGDYEEASRSYEEAYNVAHNNGYARMEAFVLTGIGDVYTELQAYDQAAVAYQMAGEIATSSQEHFLQVYIQVQQASLAGLRGDLTEGSRILQSAREMVGQNGSEMQSHLCDLEYAGLHILEGGAEEVTPLLEDTCRYFEHEGHKVQSEKAHLYLVLAYQDLDQPEKVLEHLLQLVSAQQAEYPPAALIAAAARFSNRFSSNQVANFQEDVVHFFHLVDEFQKKLPSLRRYLREHARAVPFAPPTLYIRALGKMQVQVNRHAVTSSEWQTQAARDLFFMLMAHPEGMTKDEISLIFWPDATTEEAKFRFKNTVYRLRRALGKDSVLLDQEIYRFNNSVDYEYDVELFLKENALAAKSRDPLQKLAHFREATKHYRGKFLPDIEETWVETPRENLSQTYIGILMQISEIYLKLANYDLAQDYCQRALKEDMLLEDAHRLAFRIYAAQGNRAGLVRQYQRCVEVLEREINTTPSPQTEALYQDLLK
jgi:ATP/maltotriose-dependent transcriptional regulator MalT/DNA-binding SARP family transcriptional activator